MNTEYGSNRGASHEKYGKVCYQSRYIRQPERGEIGCYLQHSQYPSKEWHQKFSGLAEESFQSGDLEIIGQSKEVYKVQRDVSSCSSLPCF